ncbi:unnamed protein product [Dibothriocephalus latus]|uniref:Uncharacterized protein n=1 Tax=Dibothriocephalus latus TaxID=60516 RepID=A0A3P7NNB8_DIBLA|nr:unnamed protein product [Dibothriocephalus latus]
MGVRHFICARRGIHFLLPGRGSGSSPTLASCPPLPWS